MCLSNCHTATEWGISKCVKNDALSTPGPGFARMLTHRRTGKGVPLAGLSRVVLAVFQVCICLRHQLTHSNIESQCMVNSTNKAVNNRGRQIGVGLCLQRNVSISLEIIKGA